MMVNVTCFKMVNFSSRILVNNETREPESFTTCTFCLAVGMGVK